MTLDTCPSENDLRNYAIGAVADDQSDEIEAHLATCSACEDTIAGFDSVNDSLMRHLPLATAGRAAAEDAPPRWLDRLRNGVPNLDPAEPRAATAADVLPLSPAEGLANYELLGVLGQGGMGVVYLARHRQLNRRVALKVLGPRALATPDAHRRFQREIALLGSLHHPGIVMATDAGAVASGAYLVMELIEGADLARVVREGGPLSVSQACEAAKQIAEALSAAHELGAIHRDVKPSNVMIERRRGRVRLLDFGLARLGMTMQESGATSVGRLLGTLDYMAPEQADGEQAVDARADLYGLGATLFYLLTGRPPHGNREGVTLLQHLRTITRDPAPRVSSLRADMPEDLDDFIVLLLSHDPALRPASADDVVKELARWAGGDLTSRAAEAFDKANGPVEVATGVAEAEKSLCDLLELSSASRAKTIAQTQTAGANRPPRWPFLTALAACAAALYFGVTILLQTSDGVLRIESEVDNVRVEVVDEKEQSQSLQVESGAKGGEFKLRAGKYRVTLAGPHDGLTLDKNTITLKRGEQTVAKITQERKLARIAPDLNIKPERLYQGKPESEWLRLFQAETEPSAKLAAANALLKLAEPLPREQEIDRLLEIGGGILEASYGDRAFEFAFGFSALEDGAPFWKTGVQSDSEGKLRHPFHDFFAQLSDQVERAGGDVLVEPLSKEILEGNNARAACACWLIGRGSGIKYYSTREGINRRLNVPLTGLNRTAICILARTWMLKPDTSDDDRRPLVSQLNQLLDQLIGDPRTDTQNKFSEYFARVIYSRPATAPVDIDKRQVSRLVLNNFLDAPDKGWWRYFLGFPARKGDSDDGANYKLPDIEHRRENSRWFLSGCPAAIIQYLNELPPEKRGADSARVVDLLMNVLRWQSDGDEWLGAKESAEWATSVLRESYENVKGAQAQSPPSTPADLLTIIALTTGEIPDFVRTGKPQSPAVSQELEKFKQMLLAESTGAPIKTHRNFDQLKGLLDQAPYETIRLSFGENKLWEKSQIVLRDSVAPLEPINLLYVTSSSTFNYYNRHAPPLDPLLLLAILADLTGENVAQDDRIARIFYWLNPETKIVLRGYLETILPSKLVARKHASRLLRDMAAKSKSPSLTDAIRQIDPSAVSSQPDKQKDSRVSGLVAGAKPTTTPVGPETAKTSATPERLYQGKPESEWLRLFKAETEPAAKLNAASAILKLAEPLPSEQELDRLLETGGEIIEASYGDRAFELVFAVEGNALAPLWRTGVKLDFENKLHRPLEQFFMQLSEQVQRLESNPPNLLSERLSDEILNGTVSRAACACFLIGPRARAVKDHELRASIFRRLNVPLTGLDRTAICLLSRAWGLKPQPSGEDLAALNSQLDQLLNHLAVFPQSEVQKRYTQFFVLVAYHLSMAATIDIDERKAAQLVLNDCVANGEGGWWQGFFKKSNQQRKFYRWGELQIAGDSAAP